jgi:hypothetical protein
MSLSILEIVESSLLNIANRYAVLTADPMVEFNILKDFDEQLNDIMERYNKLKGLQSTYTAEELQIKLIEFNLIVQDIQGKIQSGFFTGSAGADGVAGINAIDGKSAFELAVDNGFSGSEVEWLASLKGADGVAGINAIDGKSAFELAVDNGFSGSEVEWLASLKGADGVADINAIDGKSAYQLAQDNGFSGSEVEWLASLKGETGPQGPTGLNGQDGILDFNNLSLTQKQEIASFIPSTSSFSTSLLFLNDTTKAYTFIKTSIKFDSPFYVVVINYPFSSVSQTKYKISIFSVVDSVFYSPFVGDTNYSFFINNDGFLCIRCYGIGKTLLRIQCQEKSFKVLEQVYADVDSHPDYVLNTNITSYFS